MAGAAACCIAAAAKWAVVGKIEATEHPLWSSFVWRNELSDAFVETVAAPWFANAATGTPDPEPVAADARRPHRQGRLVRNLLAP